MKLEVGKYYKTRNGDKVFLRETKEEGCAGFGQPHGLYLPNGKFGYMEKGRHHCACPDLDIIAEWTDTPEVGTLKEIGAKVGDVVEWVNSDCTHHEVTGGIGVCEWFTDHMQLDGKYMVAHDRNDKFRIISRAQPGPVRTVTTTRQEIVPGDYGPISVQGVHKGKVGVCIRGLWGSDEVKGITAILGYAHLTADELTAAIATLTAIRDAMQANATA